MTRSRNEAIRTVAAGLARRLVSLADHRSGDLAALRRPDLATSAAFWKVYAECIHAKEAPFSRTAEGEDAWATLVRALAIGTPIHQNSGRAGQAGEALATANYSEARFVRLLRARGTRLHEEVTAAARFLTSKGQPADLTSLAPLLFFEPTRQDRSRKALASSYFSTQYKLQTTQEGD